MIVPANMPVMHRDNPSPHVHPPCLKDTHAHATRARGLMQELAEEVKPSPSAALEHNDTDEAARLPVLRADGSPLISSHYPHIHAGALDVDFEKEYAAAVLSHAKLAKQALAGRVPQQVRPMFHL